MTEIIKEEEHKSIFLKIMKFIGNLAMILISILLVMLIIVFALNKRTGEQPALFNHKIFVVSSNSMSPEFKTGSLLFVNTEVEGLVKGDIITFSRPENTISTTHRIVDIVEGDEKSFITRGDANNMDDPMPVYEEDIIGRVALSVPIIGYAFGFMKVKMRLLLFGLIPSIIIIFFIVKEIINELNNKKISL